MDGAPTLLWAALLGAVQGVTEFLPVSSDGHLALLQFWGGASSHVLAFDTALHLGTLAAIAVYFRNDLKNLAVGCSTRDPEALRWVGWIVLASFPTAVIGLGLKRVVDAHTLSPLSAGVGFALTAAVLWVSEWVSHRRGTLLVPPPWWHAVLLGVAQGLAVWPGLSRSASTIGVALMLGWGWKEAGRFSFLVSLPAVAGALLLTGREALVFPLAPLLAGVGVSFGVGCVSLALLMRWLALKRLWPFAAYCSGLAILCVVIQWTTR